MPEAVRPRRHLAVGALRAELTAARRRLDDVTRLVSDWVWETDASFRFTSVSARVFDMLERTPQEIRGQRLLELFDFSEPVELRDKLTRRIPFRDMPCRLVGADGKLRHVLVSGLASFDIVTGAFQGYRGTARDITRRRCVELALRRREAVLEAVSRAATVLLATPDWRVEMPELLSVLGRAADVDHIHIFEATAGGDGAPSAVPRFGGQPDGAGGAGNAFPSAALAQWERALRAGEAIAVDPPDLAKGEREQAADGSRTSMLIVPIFAGTSWWGFIHLERADEGEDRDARSSWAEPEIEAIKAAAGIIGGAIQRQRTEATIRHQAHHDPLTGLPNRTLFFDRLSVSVERSRRSGRALILLVIDLDKFHLINDAHGHRTGDLLLRKVAERLSRWVRPSDTVARLASDEFALLITAENDDRGAAIAPQVWTALAKPFAIGNEQIYVHASVGAARFPDDASDEFTILKSADAALTRAKELGGNTCQFFTTELSSRARATVRLTHHLRQALPRQQFEVFYQPIIDISCQRVIGAEALLRWRHPQFGMVPPYEFIPLAEEGGLIEDIGAWVLSEACRQARAWRDAGHLPLRVSVNVSGRQLQRGRLLTAVFAALSEAGLSPSGLCIEITESAVLADVAEARSTLERLSQMGVAIAVDDFGTGYASLTYLRQLPLAALKIDRSFIRDVIQDRHDAAIVDATLAMAHRLNLKVIAEGVEEAEQLAYLRERCCEMVQGYHFSAPVPAAEFTEILRDQPYRLGQLQLAAPASAYGGGMS